MRVRIACTVLVLLLMPFALTGCLFGPEQETSAPIDPPPAGVEEKYEKQGAQKESESKEEAKAEPKDDTFQTFAVIAVALISMGEEIGAEMSLRQFNHLVRLPLFSPFD